MCLYISTLERNARSGRTHSGPGIGPRWDEYILSTGIRGARQHDGLRLTFSKASRHSPDHLWNVDLAKSFPNVPRAWSSVASGLHHSPNCCRLRTRGFMAFAAVKDSASITVSTP